jgi:hypothetical protein
MLLAIIREAAGCYLVVTLAATGLAKLRSWRTASTGVIGEKVIPRGMALLTVIAVSVTELSLAALFAIGRYPVVVGCITAFTFLCFGGYKVAVSIKTRNISCSCYGASKTYRATGPGVLAALAASLIQAALACTWAFMPEGREGVFELPVIVAFVIPLAAFLMSFYWRSPSTSRPGTSTAR